MTGVKINNALEAEVSPINIITQKNHISIHNPAFIDNLLKHVNEIKILAVNVSDDDHGLLENGQIRFIL